MTCITHDSSDYDKHISIPVSTPTIPSTGHLERLRDAELMMVQNRIGSRARVLEIGGGSGYQAALLPRGSVATLGYANNITFFIQSVAYVSLSTAVLPFFSQMIARNDWAAISHTLRTWSSLILIVTIPVTIALLLGSGFVVRVAYQRGSFSSADTLAVARVLRFYLLQIPFYVMASLVVRVISSMRANVVLMWVTLGNLILKFGLNFLLLRYMGVSGIALAT